jgi:cell division protein FtsL
VVRWIDLIATLFRAYRAAVVVLAVVVLLVCAMVLVWREVMTHRSLASQRRRRYIMRATGATDWSMEELERWAAQLTMIRRLARRFMDRPAQALRFRLETTPRGTRYTVEGSWRIERIMNNPALRDVAITRMPARGRRGNPHLSPDMPESP